MNLSDQLRTIGARLCKRDETAIDGRMVLEIAASVASLESDLATLREATGSFLMAANDLNLSLDGVAQKLQRTAPAPDAQKSVPVR